ncbi:MAG: hemerythrin domain-containing protein [Minisyncoccia bacterium]
MTTDFIKTLVSEHQEIREIFDAVDATSSLVDKKNLIHKLQTILAPHLKKEDTELYPTLILSPDLEVRRMANIFHLTIGTYAESFVTVANKISSIQGGDIPADVVSDYENIRDRMKDRISIEEVTIFPAYEKSIK